MRLIFSKAIFCTVVIMNSFFHLKASDTCQLRLNRPYFCSYWSSSKDLVLSPIQWKLKEWLCFTSFTAGTSAIVVWVDKPIRRFALAHQSSDYDRVAKYGLEPFGSGLYTMGLVGAMYMYGYFGKHCSPKEAALMSIKAFVISGTLTGISKELFHRERPNHTDNPMNWHNPWTAWGNHSFPSGHTTVAFAVATAISMKYKKYKAVPWISYSLASLVGISRIYNNKHWTSDVVAGAIIGTVTTRFVLR